MDERPGQHAAGPDAGLACLVTVAYIHGISADAARITHEYGSSNEPLSETNLLLAAKSLGLKASIAHLRRERLAKATLPALMLDAQGHHFILAKISEDADSALIQEGGAARTTIISQSDVFRRTSGRAILLASRASLSEDFSRFDFSWFLPALVKYRRILLEVLLVSTVLQITALVTPLMFQVVMDKVLVNRAFSTLNVVCAALLISALFETLLTGLRTYVLAHTTTRIDVELSARLFRHILRVPLAYFGARRVGDTITRVRELESIRSFITGAALTSIIDIAFSAIILGVMFFYSVRLTLIVATSLPLYALISGILNPVFRQRLDHKFSRYSDAQSHLVETISGIETVKAMAVEPQFVRRWDQQLAAYVTAAFKVTALGNIGQQLIQLVGRLVTVGTLLVGARLVIDGKLTVGGLIAFNMLSQRVSAPVLRLAQLWQDFQQVGISMQRLGDILHTRPEFARSGADLPPIKGTIRFDDVQFRYASDSPLVVSGASFRIESGQVVGIVGRSGCGKSTLAKLLQKLYVPESGRITIDGHDIAAADPAWLRRQVAVVLQENLLFNRSIRDNIALADPGLPLDTIMDAARLAGIHDFITDLPKGYDTYIGEHGAGLSGGQKQRISIARALVTNPRILVFDEATSALDYETERRIQNNMRAICKGRTVIIIAHRLSAVRHADFIMAMDRGKIVEMDLHENLIKNNGYYASLVALQST